MPSAILATYAWICADAAVEGGVVAGDGERVDQRLGEPRGLLEVVVDELGGLQLQTCGRKGKGTGLYMIRALSCIMKGFPYVVRDRQHRVLIHHWIQKKPEVSSKELSVISAMGFFAPQTHLSVTYKCVYFMVNNTTDCTLYVPFNE